MELYAPGLLALYLIGCYGHLVGRGYNLEIVGNRSDGVAMAHPHLRADRDVAHQRIGGVDAREVGTAIFTRGSRLNRAARCVGYELRSIADAEHGQMTAQTVELGAERLFVIH